MSFVLGRLSPPETPSVTIPGVGHLAVVDAKVWRGAAPSSIGELRGAGRRRRHHRRRPAGRVRHRRTPTPRSRRSACGSCTCPSATARRRARPRSPSSCRSCGRVPGTVLLHCGAGVGRTGSMAAAYLVATGQASRLRRHDPATSPSGRRRSSRSPSASACRRTDADRAAAADRGREPGPRRPPPHLHASSAGRLLIERHGSASAATSTRSVRFGLSSRATASMASS